MKKLDFDKAVKTIGTLGWILAVFSIVAYFIYSMIKG